MPPIIEAHRSELERLCREFCVARLELFGSAAQESAGGQAPRDLDFLVEFQPDCPMGPFRQYIDFWLALRSLFGCDADLVEVTAIKNPYFRHAVNATRELLYAA